MRKLLTLGIIIVFTVVSIPSNSGNNQQSIAFFQDNNPSNMPSNPKQPLHDQI